MAPYRTTIFAVGLAFFALLQTSQAQNSTGNLTGQVIDVLFLRDQTYVKADLGDQQLVGSVAEAVSPWPCSCGQSLIHGAHSRILLPQLLPLNV
jgi:hypothetical protein